MMEGREFELFDQGKGAMDVAEITGMSLQDTLARWRVWSNDRQRNQIAELERRIAELERENERLRWYFFVHLRLAQ